MAKRLNDKEKKELVAFYIECQNLRETSRKFKVSVDTVKRCVESTKEIKQKLSQKKEENTKSVLEEMANRKDKKIKILDKMLDAIDLKCDNVDMFTNVKDLATAYGILIDKDLKLAEIYDVNKKDENQKKYIPAKNVAKSFVDLNRKIDAHTSGILEVWEEGGRGSLKSSYTSEKVIELLENNPKMCAIVIRQYKNTLKDSVHSQLQWAIDELAVAYPSIREDYEFPVSKLDATKKSTGQRIFFRGADEPGKIKSIKPPPGMYIGIIWYEEFDQLKGGMSAVRKINQSLTRGANLFYIFHTYNTPKSRRHFVNIEKRIPKVNRIVHLSDYRAVPVEWIGQAFVDEAEYMKSINEKIYENEYLGLETGDGGNVFENVEIRDITDEEISHFDRLYKGIDWGWYPDPFAYNNMHFDMARRTLYVFDEAHCNKKSNRETADMLLEKGVTFEDRITADSAENKSVGDYKTYGFLIRGAKKGPGSVEYSMKWLQSLAKIVIDNRRCPHTAEEFLTYEYERNKDDEIITGYPDKDNHHIDAIRYALEEIWSRRGQ